MQFIILLYQISLTLFPTVVTSPVRETLGNKKDFKFLLLEAVKKPHDSVLAHLRLPPSPLAL